MATPSGQGRLPGATDQVVPSAEMSTSRLGTALAAAAVVVSVVAAVLSPAVWPWIGVVAAVVVFVAAAHQSGGWKRAVADPQVLSGPRVRVSWWVHVVSWIAVLAGMYAMVTVLVASGFTDGRWVLALTGLVALVLGQTLGATRFLRTSGRGGTIPGHVERLRRLADRRIAPPTELVEDEPGEDEPGEDEPGEQQQDR